MSWWRMRWLGCLGSLILAVPVLSAAAAPTLVPFMPGVDSWVVTSAGSHRTYQIWVARPDSYTKQHAPYPVLYMGDANTLFGIAAENRLSSKHLEADTRRRCRGNRLPE